MIINRHSEKITILRALRAEHDRITDNIKRVQLSIMCGTTVCTDDAIEHLNNLKSELNTVNYLVKGINNGI